MTTLICWKGKDFILMAADSQVTQGHLKLPFPVSKIFMVGNSCLIGGTGSLGNIQQVSDLVLKELKVQKILAGDDDLNLTCDEVSKHLAELNFSIPLEHKHFSPFGFLTAGFDSQNKLVAFTVGDDGSKLEIPSFFSDGSGSELALSLLASNYQLKHSKETAAGLIVSILRECSSQDVFTDNSIQMYCVDNLGISKYKQKTK